MKKIIFTIPMIIMLTASCAYLLDEKPSTDLVIPDNLEDLRGLLDSDITVIGKTGALHTASSDDFYLRESGFQNVQEIFLGAYQINYDQLEQFRNGDWEVPYEQIFYCNVVLEELERINPNQSEVVEYNDIKGSAYFLRAYAYFELAVQFNLHPNNPQAINALGLPLKKEANVNIHPSQSSIDETFQFIMDDLNEARLLLVNKPKINTRPSIHALEAFFARIYLYLGKYELALEAANKALQFNKELIDFNQLNLSAARPMPRSDINPEIIFNSVMLSQTPLRLAPGSASLELFQSYEENDLRKSAYFNVVQGFPLFKGTYTGLIPFFTGLATNEMMLIVAESAARMNDYNLALEKLNQLMNNRYRQGTFVSNTKENTPDVLKKILEHRRKELVFRGLRWYDFKRLAFDSENQFEIVRKFGEHELHLSPTDLKTAFPIPLHDIELSDLIQNPR
ncbi:RagB/SusD family nutrient uptake outer membrane protein [Mongoliitalea daihaiensis]|uniref:RagB/SusD family nutrient uptake outer membrane protein n=1 Tax=Mongoliitalea daihaiensis TaxID=2782006 RepID=UPI001F3BA3BE|nr:RagB/SusD family nutrient uptake outer membrane protein [Mongoliitalea daihaiensis]UJP65821.1 RagB/SusD family nutrient uptake outer membrane protein [Mongoliitalea daihaiensis]